MNTILMFLNMWQLLRRLPRREHWTRTALEGHQTEFRCSPEIAVNRAEREEPPEERA